MAAFSPFPRGLYQTKKCAAADLPDDLRFKEDPELYPEYLEIDTTRRFSLKPIHGQYRARDIPIFKMAGKDKKYTDKHLVTVCAYDENNNLLAMCGNPRSQSHGVKMKITPRTQQPIVSIEIDTSAVRGEASTDNKVIWELSGASASCTARDVGISFDLGVRASSDVVLGSDPILKELADDGGIWRTTLTINRTTSPPRFAVISPALLDELGTKLLPNAVIDDPVSLIMALSRASRVVTYSQIRPASHESFKLFADFTRAVFFVTAHLGAFWFYKLAGKGRSINDSQFPFFALPIPRWLVTEYDIKGWSTEGKSLEPVAWSSLNSLPTPMTAEGEDIAWEACIGMARELKYDAEILRVLPKSQRMEAPFHARQVGRSDWVEANIWAMSSNSKGKLPVIDNGQRCRLSRRNGNSHDFLHGIVVDDMMRSDATCCLLLKPIDEHSRDGFLPIRGIRRCESFGNLFEFPEAKHDYIRLFDVVQNVNKGHQRRVGVDLREWCFEAARHPEQKPTWSYDHVGRNTERSRLFESVLTREGLSEEQLAAARRCLEPGNLGAVNIAGAAGTGKTKTLMALAKAYQACGAKLLVFAETDQAVDRAAMLFFQREESSADAAANEAQHPLMSRACRFFGTWTRVGSLQDSAPVQAPGEEAETFVVTHHPPMFGLRDRIRESVLNRPPEDELRAGAATLSRTAASNAGVASDIAVPYGFAEQKLRFIERLAAGSSQDNEAAEYLRLVAQISSGNRVINSAADQARLCSLDDAFSQLYIREEVDVIFTTSMSAMDPLLAENFQPDVVIQDQAAQATFPRVMAPLASFKESIKFVISAGDFESTKHLMRSRQSCESPRFVKESLFQYHVQHSPTFSSVSEHLRVQFRMHGDLCEYPNKAYYGGKLSIHASVGDETAFDSAVKDILAPLESEAWNGRRRIGVDVGDEEPFFAGRPPRSVPYKQSDSWENDAEASIVKRICNLLLDSNEVLPTDIMVVTPQLAQRCILAQDVEFEKLGIKVTTPEHAHGHEANIVILSLVMNDRKRPNNTDPLHDKDQLAIMLTRAARWLFVVGNFTGWQRIIKHGKRQAKKNASGDFLAPLCQPQGEHFRKFVSDCAGKKDIISAQRFIEITPRRNTRQALS